MGDNFLFHNRGGEPAEGLPFADVAGRAGVKQPHESFPTWFWDFDNDGWLDLFASGYHYNPDLNAGDVAADYLGVPTDAERARLFRNRGNGTFADVSQTHHLHKVLYTMGCNYVDLDNDGWLDFYVGTGAPSLRSVMPNRMFRNAGGHVFQDVTASGGFGHLQKGHGVAVGDLDNDGDQDIYAVIGGAYTGDTFQNVLFENPGHGNRWITLLLEGIRANRSAIGARVEVQVETAEGTRSIHRMVSSGASFGASSLQQEIGLGQATAIREIAVLWPGEDAVQRFADVPLDQAYRVRQGEAALIPLVRKSVSLAPERDGAAQVHHSSARD
ncbi:MAG: CRTAC1 family protein [Gemmatimonadetes bacterium]|nr:CRTAC1 family protein [Gemmatimonadota bacterium]